ncbi:hypothetical protein F5X99DRAFT_79185 [Biscogniauxia marginata]|nr:hypothetical protein F5X99DRAFT_79185 [Biscogniauxia marginata]
MVARQALATAGCSHCRLAVLNFFASPARSLPIVRTGLFRLRRARAVDLALIRRHFSLPRSGLPSSDGDAAESHRLDQYQPAYDEHDDAASESEAGDVPWYLQVEPPRHVASMEPPPLPQIPSGSPPIVGSLLEYASDEMGLSELSLLDLRQLNPPPALGPNLFMIFGTARSERHLNVSAGRLLRWLRVKHRVSADADGLLGPNERKRKLRRKARRAKLLGTMGTDEADDGMKTGWICVNLGTVGSGGAESAVLADDGRVAGFGVSHTGFTVVVQIMTESRRAEMGLETLWEQSLLRSSKREAKADAKAEAKAEAEVEAEKLKSLHPLEKAIMLSSNSRSQNGGSSRAPSQHQARFYSTQRALVHNASGPDPLFQAPSRGELGNTLLYDGHQKQRLLEFLRAYLNQLTTPLETQQALGESSSRQGPTPFLRLLELATRSLPPHRTWEYRLSIQTRARELGHGGPIESLEDIRLLIKEMRIYGIQATREQYLQLLSCIYSPSSIHLRERSKLAVELLETMHQRGQSIIANDIIVTIIEAMARATPSADGETTELINRLEKLTIQAKLPCLDEPLLMRLMDVHVHRRDWGRLWNIWRMPPRYLRSRSAALYAHMYQLAASTRSAAVCAVILRRCFHEMLSEDPPIQLTGDVFHWMMQCVRVADPGAEKLAATLPLKVQGHGKLLANREFVKFLRSIRILLA